jgi:hypothetical protein
MDSHAAVADLLGAWALGACDADEEAAVEAHLDQCTTCAAEARQLRSAASWLGVEAMLPPPPALRDLTLAKAREQRPPTSLHTLTAAYAMQVNLLDRALARVGAGDWHRAEPHHGDVLGLVSHLTGNDAQLAADLGLPVISDAGTSTAGARTNRGVHAAWRAQADILIDGVTFDLDAGQPVRLAGTGPPILRPLREALVQRAFETWTHLDDLGIVIGRPPSEPPPDQVRRIVDLAVGLLPDVLRVHGVTRPGRTARLALDGTGGGEWTVPLGHRMPGAGAVELTIYASAVDFARLVANRRQAETFDHIATGDSELAVHLLRVASTLGCD